MDELLERTIRDAFPDLPLPEQPLTTHRCSECDEVDAVLAGRSWLEVAAAFPAYCHDAFALLTPVARAYYLPAYMIAALDPETGLQGISLETAMEDGRLDPRCFTPAQRAAVWDWAKACWRLIGEEAPPTSFAKHWADACE
jgi:hypothetical protein